jgi:simple sugar transport system ATP-binding protein
MLAFRGVSKLFGELRAVDRVDLEISGGAVTALLGENGAGKSTLMKLLYGVHQPDTGHIEIENRTAWLPSPAQAIRQGIGMVFQHFTLLPALTVLENLLLSWPGTRWLPRRSKGAVLQRLRHLAPHIRPDARVADLTVGERQLVELVRVLNMDARCVILDEPTSVLTPIETERFFQLVKPLAREGRAVILITHKMADVRACAERIVVMRKGRVVDVAKADARTVDELVQKMVGDSSASDGRPSPAPPHAPARFFVHGLAAGKARDIGFELRAGEILGVAGVAGNGQRDLAEALAAVIRAEAGEATLDGSSILGKGATDPRVAYIPEQPRENAVAGALSSTINLALRRLRDMPAFPDWRKEQKEAAALMQRFDVRPPEPRLPPDALSGGNLQKLVVARELSAAPELVVACYPTMGLDLAATHAIHRELLDLAQRGSCIVWFSEELDELMVFAHRIAVMHGGRIAGVLAREAATRQQLGRLMAGREAA